MQWLGRALGLGEAPSQGTPRSRCAPSAGQGRFSGHTSLPASPPRLEGTARPLVRKRQPAKSVAAAAQYASAGAPGRGRSQFRRESRARRNPREAGPEPGGRACLPEGVDLGWRVCSSANSHLTDDGGRLEPRLCPSQTFRQKSELYPGHEDSREAGSRDNGVWGAGEGSMAGPTRTPRRLRRPRLRRPSRQLPQHLWGGEGIWVCGRDPGSRAGSAPEPSYWAGEGVLSCRLPIGTRVQTPRPIGLFRFGHQIQRF